MVHGFLCLGWVAYLSIYLSGQGYGKGYGYGYG